MGALLGALPLAGGPASLEAAKASLPDDALEVVEQLAAVTAGVCYDIGDEAALQRALGELQASSHRLVTAGAIVLAARLLNDQAAVYMRGGDLVRATASCPRRTSVSRVTCASIPMLWPSRSWQEPNTCWPAALHVQVPLDTRRTLCAR